MSEQDQAWFRYLVASARYDLALPAQGMTLQESAREFIRQQDTRPANPAAQESTQAMLSRISAEGGSEMDADEAQPAAPDLDDDLLRRLCIPLMFELPEPARTNLALANKDRAQAAAAIRALREEVARLAADRDAWKIMHRGKRNLWEMAEAELARLKREYAELEEDRRESCRRWNTVDSQRMTAEAELAAARAALREENAKAWSVARRNNVWVHEARAERDAARAALRELVEAWDANKQWDEISAREVAAWQAARAIVGDA